MEKGRQQLSYDAAQFDERDLAVTLINISKY